MNACLSLVSYAFFTLTLHHTQEFFILTVLAIKMNHELADEVLIISPEDLFNKALDEKIQFYEFHGFIKQNLTMYYLESISTQRLENKQISDVAKRLSVSSPTPGGSLRQQRRSVMANLASRREKQKQKQQSSIKEQ
jgi:hypothetical protein